MDSYLAVDAGGELFFIDGEVLRSVLRIAWGASDRVELSSKERFVLCGGTGGRIPEPATLTIFGFALAGLGLMGWRRRKAA